MWDLAISQDWGQSTESNISQENQSSVSKLKPCITSQSLQRFNNVGLHDNFHLPPRNEFIATQFDIKKPGDDAPSVPILIKDTALTKLWFKQDDTFFMPKSCLNMQLYR